ncbi:MAG: hypothetical protein V4710_07575, partial [Verrucomicrobiota bacterium]
EMHGHFVDELKTLAGKTGSQLQKPEDQWPVLLCVLPPDRQAVTRELSAELIGEEGSELVEQSIGELAREHKAVALALICPSWLQWESTAGEVRNDGYREVLILQAIRADTVARYVAQILRSPDKAPVLGNWEKISEEMNIEHRRTDAAGPITQTKQT